MEFNEFAQGKHTLAHARHFWRKPLALPAYHLIVVACAATLVLHISDVPLWLSLFAGISVFTALPLVKQKVTQWTNGRLKIVYKTVQSVLFVAGMGGLWLTYGGYSTDIAIGFLLLCLFAKLWELYAPRDGYVIITLSLFVIAAAFLWSQALSLALISFGAVALAILALIALADDSNATGAGRLRTLGFLMLPSIPMLVVLFIFFPRIDPLWQIQLAGQQAQTGVSDSMSPGDFANLSKSTELAFRVEFAGQIPSRTELYWRGLVFHYFDGKTWTQGAYRPERWYSTQQPVPSWAMMLQGVGDQYKVILEPTQQPWLFVLGYSRPAPKPQIWLSSELTVRQDTPVSAQLRYGASYFPSARMTTLTEEERKVDLQLPAGNPKTRALATELYNGANKDPKAFIAAVERYIRTNDFYYTLNPPALGSARVDEFLFGSRQGFCEHYASSFVFMARAVGIPARVVTGYQGGQLGRDGTSFEVRQMDAHAWAEVWTGAQWQRVDPTAFVAPERILEGMADYTEMQGASVFGEGLAGRIGYQQFQALQSLRRFSDQLGYYWQKDVVGYDSDSQKKSLFDWFNIRTIGQQIGVIVGGLALILVLFTGVVWYRRRVICHPFDKPLARLSIRLAKRDKTLAKQPSESYLAYLHRLTPILENPNIALLANEYRSYRFGRLAETADSAEYRKQAKAFAQQIAKLG